MEAIRNYLETMFAHLPNTMEVQKAKYELGQMMEDKYTELRGEGKSDKEAVDTVIAEFGDLDELADMLGIRSAMQAQVPYQGRVLRQDEAENYQKDSERYAFLNGLGVLLCIVSPVTFILAYTVAYGTGMNDEALIPVGTGVFFALLAAAVSLFIYSSTKMGTWKYLKKEPVCIDYPTAERLHREREAERGKLALQKTVGILCCIFCFVPVAVIGAYTGTSDAGGDIPVLVGSMILFVMLGLGVLILMRTGGRENARNFLLRLNDRETMSGAYVPSQYAVRYSNKTLEAIMSIYMPAVLCVYLIWSFLTFDWHITWIIWPVAAVVRNLIQKVWGERGPQA